MDVALEGLSIGRLPPSSLGVTEGVIGFAVSSVYHCGHEEGGCTQIPTPVVADASQEDLSLLTRQLLQPPLPRTQLLHHPMATCFCCPCESMGFGAALNGGCLIHERNCWCSVDMRSY
jgi:hypothetical protein